MGNKNGCQPKAPGASQTKDGATVKDISGSISRDAASRPSPELLASLQSLGENGDYTLLPHSLHQMAEAYSLKQDYQWAIQFLQLEKIYHQRLLSNLAALQENWESQWREKNAESRLPADTDDVSQKHIDALRHICETHLRPSVSAEKNRPDAELTDIQSNSGQHRDKARNLGTKHQDEEEGLSVNSSPSPQEDGEEGHTYEEGQEVEEEEEEEQCEETPEDEEVKVEWPTGVPQASDKELAKLSHAEGNSSPDGLVSILKRRRASLDGLPPPSNMGTKQNCKRKVRFSEPEDGIEQDEAGGDSCLILLLLCAVTVVISIVGTALYCTLVGTYSNICTDFTLNVDFYMMKIRRFFDGLGHWLPLWT